MALLEEVANVIGGSLSEVAAVEDGGFVVCILDPLGPLPLRRPFWDNAVHALSSRSDEGNRAMITTPTVLILGAGASMPFGFPSGGQLKEAIASPTQEQISQLGECGFPPRTIADFQLAIRRSPLNSVDAFLENRSDEFGEVGKAAIAQNLIPHEILDHSDLYAPYVKRGTTDEEQNWYHFLFNRLHAPLEKFSENKLSVITFNYDRSFEAFLVGALKYTYGIDDDMAIKAACSIPVIHLHGQLGFLDWQCPKVKSDKTILRHYEHILNHETILCGAKGIKIIHEVEEDHSFVTAYKYIKEASRIFFLGFGYHPLNMERLRLADLVGNRNTQVCGSVYGMTDAEMQHSARIKPVKKITVGQTHHKVCQFLRECHQFQPD